MGELTSRRRIYDRLAGLPAALWRACVERAGWSALVLILIVPLLAVSSLLSKSSTADEAFHLSAGYTHLVEHDFRRVPEHPPLMKSVSGLMLHLFADVNFDHDSRAWRDGNHWQFGADFLNRWNRPDRLLFLGRLPMVALSMAVALSVFLWSRRLFGDAGALLSLALYVFGPNLLAHGRLVTTDLPIAAGVLWSAWAAELLLQRITPRRLLALAAALSFAALVKLSAVLLAPTLAVLAGVRVVVGSPWPAALGRREIRLDTLGRRLVAAIVLTALLVLFTCGAIWAVYGFRYRAVSDDSPTPAAWSWSEQLAARGAPQKLIVALRDARVLPEGYLYGLAWSIHHQEGRSAFAAGRYSSTGWRWYFPYTFLIKTPLPVLALLLLSVTVRVRERKHLDLLTESAWVLPVAVFFGFAMTSHLNIGHRHLLPIYPLLFVGLGHLGRAWQAAGRGLVHVGVPLLVALTAVSTVSVHPHYLAHFNLLAGGPSGGYRHLVDSNLDWGQDLKGLSNELRRRGVERVHLSYFGSAAPRAYGFVPERAPAEEEGIRYVPLVGYSIPDPDAGRPLAAREWPPGFYAISATNLQGVYLRQLRDLYAPFRRALDGDRSRIRPRGHVGFSIFLFEVER